jgi:hypothetical protein
MPELQGQSDQVQLLLQAAERPRLRRLLRQWHGSGAVLKTYLHLVFQSGLVFVFLKCKLFIKPRISSAMT